MSSRKIHYAWITLAGTCSMMSIGFGMALDATGVFFPAVTEYLGTGTGPVSTYLTVQGICMVIGMAFAGRIIPKYNYNIILLIASIIMSGGFMFMSTFTELWQWYATAVPMGISIAFIAPMPISIIISNWFEKKRGVASGIAYAFSGIAGCLLVPLANWAINVYGWRSAYMLYGIIAAIFLIPTALFIVRKTPEEKNCLPYGAKTSKNETANVYTESHHVIEYGMTFKEAIRKPAFYLVVCTAIFLTWGGALQPHFPTHAVKLGLTATQGSIMSSVSLAMQLVFNVPLGAAIDKLGVGKSVVLFSGVAAMGSVIMAFTSVPTLFYIGSMMYGVGMCETIVVSSMLTRIVFGRKEYSQIQSIVMMAFGMFGAASHSVNGFLSDITGSYMVPFVIAAAASALSIATCNAAIRMEKEQVERNKNMEGVVI